MFAPLGFVSLEEVYERLSDEAEKWRVSTPHEADPFPSGERDENAWNYISDRNYRRPLAYTEWLFQCFLNRHEGELFACGSNGMPLKLSLSIVRRFKFYDGAFQDDPNGWDGIVSHTQDPFTNISRFGFVISLDQARKWLHEAELFPILPTLQMIEAAPVCWRLPNGGPVSDWLGVCGVAKEDGNQNTDVSLVAICGRILEAKRRDPAIARDEIKDLVSPTVSWGLFRLAWAMAASKEPSISKPGRKSR
jgi:hypothetical protein